MREYRFRPFDFPPHEATKDFYYCTYWAAWVATNLRKANEISNKYEILFEKLI